MAVSEPMEAMKAGGAIDTRVSFLGELARRIGDRLDSRELGQYVYGELREFMSADSFFLVQASLQSEGMHGVLVMDEEVEYPADSICIEPYDEGITQEPILFTSEDNRQRWTFGTGRPSASCLTCTMRARGRLVGQISVMSYREHAYSSADVWLLQAVAHQLTTAFDRILEGQEAARREDELRGLVESSRLLSTSLEVTAVLRGLATSLAKTLGASAVVISRLDRDDTRLVPCAHAAAPDVSLGATLAPFSPAGHGSLETVLQQRQTVAGADPIRWPVAEGWQARLALPMIVEDTVLGLVELVSRRPDARFSGHEIDICQRIIDQAAVWVHHAQVHQRVLDRGESLTGLAALSEAISNAADDLPTVLRLICEEANTLLRMDSATLFLLDPMEAYLELKASSGFVGPLGIGARVMVEDPYSHAARAVRERRMVVETDVTHGGHNVTGWQPLNDVGSGRSAIAIPLRHHGMTLGALLLVDQRRHPGFPTEDLRLLSSVSGQAAAAIARARLRAAEHERLQIASVLGTISESLGADSNPAAIYATILDQAAHLIPFAEAGITLFEEGRQHLAAATGPVLSAIPESQASQTLWRHHGNLDAAVCRTVPEVWEPLTSAGVEDLLSLPLLVNGAVMGRLTFVSLHSREYDAHTAQLAALLAERTANVARSMQLRRAEQSALAKLTALDALRQDFVATVSHELRTPLTGILGYLELLINRWSSLTEERRHGMLERAQSAAARLEHLVNDLLLFSNVEHQDIQLQCGRFPLQSLVDQAVEELGTKYRGQVIDVHPGPPGLYVMADAQRAIQVIANVLDNAVKYSHVGAPVHLGWTAHRATARISIRDHGPGISKEDLPRLFQRFSTLGHPPRPGQVGTGIGLYICKKIMEAMDGRITVTSRPGTGSTFHITLPLS
ncbi:MAG TPA: GAF domain-containing protein [Chloroflexota bacterium]